MADSAAAAAAAPMTIDFLRARLLSERSVSCASKERADQLATRVAELEEQVRAATTERRQAEREAAEVLAILESQGFCGRSLSGSASDNDGDEDKDDARVTHGDAERSNRREERQQEPPPANALSGTPAGGLSWKGRSVSPRKARQLMQRHRRSHLYLLASGSDLLPKYRMGQSCRKNKRKELRSATPEGDGGCAVLVEGRKGQQNGSDRTDDGRTELHGEVDGDERNSGDGGQYVMRYEKDGEMERVLEKQAELIGQHEAEEEAQRDWERKFNDTRGPPKGDVARAKSNGRTLSIAQPPENKSGAHRREADEEHGHAGAWTAAISAQGSSNNSSSSTSRDLRGDANSDGCPSHKTSSAASGTSRATPSPARSPAGARRASTTAPATSSRHGHV